MGLPKLRRCQAQVLYFLQEVYNQKRLHSALGYLTPEEFEQAEVASMASSHMVLLLMLRTWKMNPTDVQAMLVGSSPAMMAALEKGGIDAAVLTEPTFFIAEDLGYRVLADLADMDIYYLHSMIDTTRSFLRSQRDLATRFIKAYVERIAYFKKNRPESVEVMKKKLRTATTQEILYVCACIKTYCAVAHG